MRRADEPPLIETHPVTAGDTTVAGAHGVRDRSERVPKAEVPDAVVIVDIDPEGERRHQGIVVL